MTLAGCATDDRVLRDDRKKFHDTPAAVAPPDRPLAPGRPRRPRRCCRPSAFKRHRVGRSCAGVSVPSPGGISVARSTERPTTVENPSPASMEDPPHPRLRRQSTLYQHPFEMLQPQAGNARAMVDLDPRCTPPPKIASRHDHPPRRNARASSRRRPTNGGRGGGSV